ncbi:MAG TPA: hypothetical protein EYP06_04800, partial [Desulfobacterales bacterium]|nr:hypothetical protein [Desulfobacterales bacterium]
VVSISDARILLFPVYSMVGPVWVTSPTALEDAELLSKKEGNTNLTVAQDKARWGGNESELPRDKPLNLGWLMVEREGDIPPLSWPEENKIPEGIKKRVVLVSDKLFSQIVNSNLEVRTSVSINPETGAAEEGALFTYEAIPRATVLWIDVVVDDYRRAFPDKKKWEEICQELKESFPDELPDSLTTSESILHKLGYIPKRPSSGSDEDEEDFKKRLSEYWKSVRAAHHTCKDVLQSLDWSIPHDIVHLGFEWAEHLGIGGMGTRGFGRIKQIASFKVQTKKFVPCNDSSSEAPAPSTKSEGGAS